MSIVVIENNALRIALAPHYGARVTSLADKATGREWMTQGEESRNTGEDAIYRSAEAVGWDECFPTVGLWDGTATPWQRRLRDHGDLWGRPWAVDELSATRVTASYADPQFRFTRELRLEGATLVARYSVSNLSGETLPYLWTLHALLAVTPGDRIELVGVDRVHASYLSLGGKMLHGGEIAWHGRSEPLPFGLDEVQPRRTAFAGKFLAGAVAGGSARVGRSGEWLTISWDKSIADLGIWLTYGGWPAPGGHQEAALEPTNAAANHLGEAIEIGAPPLLPDEHREWCVTFSVARD